MGKMCSIFGRVRDKKTGKLTNKISLLHKDLLGLLEFASNFGRKKANEAFLLSQSDKFLSQYSDELLLDINEEPLLASFYEVASKIMPEVTLGDMKNFLAKKFGAGEYSYQEAYSKMTAFNTQMQGAHSFMGTIIPLNNGKFKFDVVYNAKENLLALINTIAKKKLADRIIEQLEKQGVGVSEGKSSIYNTMNPEVLVNGLLGVIEIKNKEFNLKDVSREVGHFIISALGDSPLALRLINIIDKNPQIADAILGGETLLYEGNPNKKREFVGHIIGKYLENYDKLESNTILGEFKRILNRAIEWVKSRFHITNRQYYKDLYDAKMAAFDMVKNFMGNNFKGTLNNALETKELLHGEDNKAFQILNSQLKELYTLVEKSVNYNTLHSSRIHKNYKDKFNELAKSYYLIFQKLNDSKGLNYLSSLEVDAQIAQSISTLIRFIANELSQASILLNKTSFSQDGVIFKDPTTGNEVTLSDLAKAISYSQDVLNIANDIINSKLVLLENITDEGLKIALKESYDLLSKIVGNYTEIESGKEQKNLFQNEIIKARRRLAVRILTLINGSQFLYIEQHVSIGAKKKLDKAGNLKKGIWALGLKRTKGLYIDLYSELSSTNINPPAQWYTRWIDSMADNPDIINQMVYDLVELKKHEANVKTLEIKDKLIDLYEELRSIGIKNTKVFFEVYLNEDLKGKKTGNLISNRNWGEWEKDWKEYRKEFNDKFYEEFKDILPPSRADMYHNEFYLTKFAAAKTLWDKDHSIKIPKLDKDGNPLKDAEGQPLTILAPLLESDLKPEERKDSRKVYYYNSLLDDLKRDNPKAYEWYLKYMYLKRSLDELLPNGTTNPSGLRAPLFKIFFTDRLLNIMTNKGLERRFLGLSLRESISYQLSLNPEDAEYGGEDDTYDEDELEDKNGLIFTRTLSNALSVSERVPKYGIRKFKNSDLLSTDLIHSTLAYAAMAESYNCLSEVSDAVVETGNILQERKVNNEIPTRELLKVGKGPDSYHRLLDYIHMQVFNNYTYSSDSSNSNKLLRKLFARLGRYSSFWYLGGNVPSAITNLFTNFNMVFKEAWSSEQYDLKDFMKANLEYFKYTTAGVMEKAFNIVAKKGSINESTNFFLTFVRHFDVKNSQLREFKDYRILTKGYGVTKGWSLINLAMLPYSMTESYVQGISYIASSMHKTIRDKETKEEMSLWDAYKREFKKTGNLQGIAKMGKESKDSKFEVLNINAKNTRDLILKKLKEKGSITIDELKFLNNYQEYVPWDSQVESRFGNMCRGIDNRLNGVMNSSDSGAYQLYFLTLAIASMKKYSIGIIDDRFSRSRFDFRSLTMKLGSTVTLGNIAWDSLFTNYIGLTIDLNDPEGIKTIKKSINTMDAINNVVGRFFWGLTKIAYIYTVGLLPYSGVHLYLMSRGYSKRLIANTKKATLNVLIPEILKWLMSMCVPPEDDENPEEDNAFSSMLTDLYITNAKVGTFGLVDFTPNDDKLFTPEYLKHLSMKTDKTIPFSLKGILYYLLYRTFSELVAYNIVHLPTYLDNSDFHSGGLYSEYKSITNSTLLAASGLWDMTTLIHDLSHELDEDDIQVLLKEDPKLLKNYHITKDKNGNRTGKLIYVKGAFEGMYKGPKHYLSSSFLTRWLLMWENGYRSVRNQEFAKNISKKN